MIEKHRNYTQTKPTIKCSESLFCIPFIRKKWFPANRSVSRSITKIQRTLTKKRFVEYNLKNKSNNFIYRKESKTVDSSRNTFGLIRLVRTLVMADL